MIHNKQYDTKVTDNQVVPHIYSMFNRHRLTTHCSVFMKVDQFDAYTYSF